MNDTRNRKSETKGNSPEAQRNRLLAYLKKHKTITTFQARHMLDIVAPAARIFDLRHRFDLDIEKVMVLATNPGGGQHRIAKYILND